MRSILPRHVAPAMGCRAIFRDCSRVKNLDTQVRHDPNSRSREFDRLTAGLVPGRGRRRFIAVACSHSTRHLAFRARVIAVVAFMLLLAMPTEGSERTGAQCKYQRNACDVTLHKLERPAPDLND